MRAETPRGSLYMAAITTATSAMLLACGGSSGAARRAAQPQPASRQPSAVFTAVRRCFGAAARDPERRRCEDPKLRYSVVPTPSDALLMPNSPCTIVGRSRSPEVCAFGVRAARASAHVALVGDSHAAHWRPAVDVVARAKRWHALTLYRSGCPLSTATPRLRGSRRGECTRWKAQVLQWLGRHREVGTLVMSANATTGVSTPPGQDPFAFEVAGYLGLWQTLPRTIERIIVIRDPPHQELQTAPCVERTIARHRPTERACPVPRGVALHADALTEAVKQARSPRIVAVDLTPFMCDAHVCYPVVGGVLVHKDQGHLTRTFARSLGPFLKRAIDRLIDAP